MASTVSGKGIDHYKWHRLLSEKASTIINGIDCYQKRHRPLKMASLVYERENCVGERPLAQAVKSYERADPFTLPVISPESRFDPGNLIGRLEKRFLQGLLLVKCATILVKPVLQSFP